MSAFLNWLSRVHVLESADRNGQLRLVRGISGGGSDPSGFRYRIPPSRPPGPLSAFSPQDPEPKGYRAFSPIMDTFLKEHLFADIFARDVLDFKTRELVTISVLVSSDNIMDRFIKGHMKISMNMGLTKEQMFDFVKVIEQNIGKEEAKKADMILKSLIEKE